MKRVLLGCLTVGCVQPAPSREGSQMLWDDGPPGGTTQQPGDPCDNLPVDVLYLAPRLISPLSTSRATTRRPTLTWSACSDVRVQICADRSCSLVLSNHDVAGESFTPSSDLTGSGNVYFWRVASRVGSQIGAWSKTWQVWVPAANAPVSSSGGSVLDADLDKWPEFSAAAVRAETQGVSSGVVHLYEGGRRTITDPFRTLTQPSPDDDAVFGRSHGSAGDVNGDGFADFLVGAPAAEVGRSVSGMAYLYFGSASGLGATPTELPGPLESSFGYSVSDAGDLNGDGYGDFLVGAVTAGTFTDGLVHVYHGKPGTSYPQPSEILYGSGASQFGVNVSGVGDLNGDGYGDIAVGDTHVDFWSGNNPAGKVFVWFGGPDGVSGPGLELVSPDPSSKDGFGYSISEAADLDGDGYHDLIVGAGGTDGENGAAYVWYGGPSGLSAAPDLALAPPVAGQDFFGLALSAAGDLDGDGLDDLILGETDSDGLAGQVHVMDASGDLTQLENPDTSMGYFGQSLAIIGDVDNNGLADFLVGAPGGGGAAHLFLSTGSPPVAADAQTLTPTGDGSGWVGI